MSNILKAELVELFMQEAASYIPGIRQSLATLAADGPAPEALEELHRLFHTIKGAASQVEMTDLSRGARVVETFLSELIEEGRELSSQHLAALERITGMLSMFVENHNSSPEMEEAFHAGVVAQFDDLTESAENGSGLQAAGVHRTVLEEQQECLHAIRSIVPLLQELAGCLVPGEKGREDHNAMVYRKLSRAVAVFTTAVRAAGMDRQYQLMQDFQLLLGELRAGGMWRQPEIAGLIGDFFRFLEAVFTHSDPENSSTVHRVKDQLRAFHTLLAGTTSDAAEAEFAFDEEIFAAPEGDDESVILLEQLVDNELLEETEEAPEIPADMPEKEAEIEPVSEEQLLLQEIFRSECDEHLIVINRSLNTLEQQVEQPCSLTPDLRETVSAMRRAVHTLKGAASMTGVNLLAQGAHSLEDLLDWIHDDADEISPAEVRILATGIDVIELLAQSPAASGSAHLNRLVETIKGHLAKAAGDQATAIEPDETAMPEALEETAPVAVDRIASPEAVEMEEPAVLPGDSGVLRVRLDDLDELVSIEGELVVARGAVEKMLDEFGQTLIEFDNVKENLRRKSQELEAGFEVKSLYGFNPVAPGGGANDSAESDFSEFDPIELDRYSQLNLIIRSLNEITVDINSIHATLALLAGDIRGQVSKQQLTMRLMQDKLMRIRMTPMSSLSRMLFRIVRETARKLNKKVNLVITGEDVYMDRFVWAKITDPLMHILRNAVDHGIESAEGRRAANKPETATIRLEADQRSRFVVLRVSDDGGGVDLERIKAKLRSEGLVANPDALGENELIEYLFHPSFTTRWDVSTISGRGIGLDVVRKNIQELRGSVQLHNNPGKGVSFEFHIPFTLSVNRAAIVSAAGREFAVPLQDIQQVKRYRISELETGDGLFLRFGEGLIAVSNLGYHLQLENRQTDLPAGGEGLLAIVFKRGEELHAVSIEEVVEQREIIVKSLGSHLTHVPGVSGVTLTGSGELIPILNLRELTEIQAPVVKGPDGPVLTFGLNEPLKVLIVDDSISVRHSVARLVESQAWKQQQAVDGLDALAKLETFRPDVIVLDIEMPRMNGYEFKSTINNNEAYRDIPVIMLTSRTSEKHQQKARELGIHHYMTKPYQEAAFVRLLENIRGGSQTV